MSGCIRLNTLKREQLTSSSGAVQNNPASPSLKEGQRMPGKEPSPTDNVLLRFIDHAVRFVERAEETESPLHPNEKCLREWERA